MAVGGELDVTVRESNGEEQHFSVPFQTPAIALHEGYFKYSVMGGNIKKKV
ncbi:fimbria/pilus outer membrane usher protein [Shigella flexneri]